jgi:hypothetical protein
MNRFSVPLTRLVHENLSVVMCFAYSQKPLSKMVEDNFSGEWKYLNKVLFEISAERAEKACLELALFLRMLDDKARISDYHKLTKNILNCGRLVMRDNSGKPLPFREVANKIIHSSKLEWKFSKGLSPILICHTRDEESWLRADVDLVALAAVCGGLMS